MRSARFGSAGLVVALTVTIAGCSGGGGSVEGASTTLSASTTTTAVATTVPRSTTTATTKPPSPAEDPVALLASVNAEMGEGHSFLIDLSGQLKESATAGSDLVTAKANGGHSGHGNSWLSGNSSIANPSRTAVLGFESRQVGGVSYNQSPATGLWEIGTSDDVDPVNAALVGQLQLEGLSVEETPGTYVLRGQVPGDPAIQQVEVVVDKDDLVIEPDRGHRAHLEE